MKHSKYRNTGILFELLTRQLTSDTIAGGQSKALSILKKYFNSKTELLKEYKIYHTLATKKYKKESNANILLNTLTEAIKSNVIREDNDDNGVSTPRLIKDPKSGKSIIFISVSPIRTFPPVTLNSKILVSDSRM